MWEIMDSKIEQSILTVKGERIITDWNFVTFSYKDWMMPIEAKELKNEPKYLKLVQITHKRTWRPVASRDCNIFSNYVQTSDKE